MGLEYAAPTSSPYRPACRACLAVGRCLIDPEIGVFVLAFGESNPPKHHSTPEYEHGSPPSSANRWLISRAHARASCGDGAHGRNALPHVMRTLLWSSP